MFFAACASADIIVELGVLCAAGVAGPAGTAACASLRAGMVPFEVVAFLLACLCLFFAARAPWSAYAVLAAPAVVALAVVAAPHVDRRGDLALAGVLVLAVAGGASQFSTHLERHNRTVFLLYMARQKQVCAPPPPHNAATVHRACIPIVVRSRSLATSLLNSPTRSRACTAWRGCPRVAWARPSAGRRWRRSRTCSRS